MSPDIDALTEILAVTLKTTVKEAVELANKIQELGHGRRAAVVYSALKIVEKDILLKMPDHAKELLDKSIDCTISFEKRPRQEPGRRP